MNQTLQKASLSKRIAAWMFDGIMTAILAIGLGLLLSAVLGYDRYSDDLNAAYEKYETQYGVTFEISYEEYEAMTQAEKDNYDAAYDALIADEEAVYAYNMTVNLTLSIVTLSLLVAILLWDLVVPLFLNNGQTLGKKIFSLCLVRNDGVKANNLQLVARTLLGKYVVETMIPVLIVLMILVGMIGATGTFILLALLAAQFACIAISRNNCAIHDMMAGTVVVDIHSQAIFNSTEELIAYQKRVAAERAARQTY
jgi:uncharacterized RDD family membrane protein YckC